MLSPHLVALVIIGLAAFYVLLLMLRRLMPAKQHKSATPQRSQSKPDLATPLARSRAHQDGTVIAPFDCMMQIQRGYR